MQRISVILIDDHSMILEGLESLFASRSDIKVVAKLNGIEAVKNFCRSYKPNANDVTIALCDLSFKHSDLCKEKEVGFEIVKILRAAKKNIKCIIYSMHNSASYAQYALSDNVGAMGYVLKDSEKSVVFDAIRSVANNNVYVQAEVAHSFLKSRSVLQVLTPRERAVAECIGMSFAIEEIAEKLCISRRTVENYISRLYDKTGTASREELTELLNGLAE